MKKRREIILISSILVLAILWRYLFWSPGVFGADTLYHYTIVEQAIEKGKLSNENNLAVCYEGVKGGHPVGFYAIPYFIGKSIGLDKAFIVIPMLLGILGLLVAYVLLKNLFNIKVALITLFFSAISLAHVSKSFPFSYRGENVIFPFLALSLLFLYKAYKDKKRSMAVGSGIVSGITMWFWNGYPLVIIIFLASSCSYLIYKYWRKEKDIQSDIKMTAISIIAQGITLGVIALTTNLWGKGEIFWRDYYPAIVGASLVMLATVYLSIERKTHMPLIIIGIISVISTIWFIPQIKEVFSGFGSIQAHNLAQTPELLRPQLNQLFFAFHVLLLTSLAGILTYIKKFDEKKAFFLGLLLPSLYLVFSATRYVYFATIPIITLAAIFLDNKKIVRKKFDIFIFVTAALMILLFIYSLYAIPRFYTDNLHIKETKPYKFLRESSEKDACIMDISSRGATVEYFAKRYFFFHSLGYHIERNRIAANILMTGDTSEIEAKNFYILLNYADLIRINLANRFANLSDIGYYRIVTNYGSEGMDSVGIVKELDFMRMVFINNTLYSNQTGKGCAYITEVDAFYFKDGVCNTPFYRIATNQSMENFTNVYFENGYSIYKYTPTNNHERRELQEES